MVSGIPVLETFAICTSNSEFSSVGAGKVVKHLHDSCVYQLDARWLRYLYHYHTVTIQLAPPTSMFACQIGSA